ncbi:zinc-dependent alcohol dehydrogenase family protein [Nocardia alni]|uniref:zinc-dependent alcohol dehydrogenase family protein n=1 Tax=Nocardia alni TaxID=2815723 RepID=UPI001C22DBB8|nr:NAD(P)-dependent alcohol dehydrogenase [Nocardia alni]
MRAYQFEDDFAPESLRLVERPDPIPGERDIVLRMRAVAVNYRDLAIMRGEYHTRVSPPLVPLSDGVGEVVHVGPAVTRFRVGDLACPTYLPLWIDGPLTLDRIARRLGGPDDGVLTELMRLSEHEAVRAPDHLDPAEAATLPVSGVTTWHSLFELDRLRPDETILVQGSGGVSTIAIQLAAAAGARVIAVTRTNRYTDRLRDLGADHVLTTDSSPDWPSRVAAHSGGGVDVAVNTAGGPTLTPTIAATRMGGRVHLVGYAAGRRAELDVFTAIQHATTIHLARGGNRTDFESLVKTVEHHRIRPAVDRTFPLDQLHDAFDHLAHGGHLGKVIITPTF